MLRIELKWHSVDLRSWGWIDALGIDRDSRDSNSREDHQDETESSTRHSSPPSTAEFALPEWGSRPFRSHETFSVESVLLEEGFASGRDEQRFAYSQIA